MIMRSKFVSLALGMAFILSGCQNNTHKYEYKIVRIPGKNICEVITGIDAFPSDFDDQTAMLNKMATQGWELDNVYTEIETAYPNFGDKHYHTGIKTNTKTRALNFIFKRDYNPQKTVKTVKK